jgi:DNA repair exonuclease SbcCD ATPase subunit
MRNIIFEEVGMENYGPYIDPMILKFNSDKLILITGPNGVGKTMSLDAIPFALFGNTSKGAKGDDVVNNSVGKNCKVWLKFKVNNDNYIVTRYHKYNRLGNTVIINKNGVDTKKGQKEVLPEIEKIVCPMKTFMNTLMFGQKVKDFFTDLIDSDKKEIFRKILGLEIYADYYKKADEKLKAILSQTEDSKRKYAVETELANDSVLQIKALEVAQKKFYEEIQERIKQLKESLETNNRLLEKWKQDLQIFIDANIDEQIKTINEKIGSIRTAINSIDSKYRTKLSELENAKNQKIAEIKHTLSEHKQTHTNNARVEIDKWKQEESDLKESFGKQAEEYLSQMSANEVKIMRWKSLNESLNERIKAITGVATSDEHKCPLCEREVDDKACEFLNFKCKYYIDQVREYETNIEDHQVEIKTIKQKYDDLKRSMDVRVNQLKKLIIEAQTLCASYIKESEERANTALENIEKLARERKEKIEDEKRAEKIELENDMNTSMADLGIAKKQLEERQKIEKVINGIEREISNIQSEVKIRENEKYDTTQLHTYQRKLHAHLGTLDSIKEQLNQFEQKEKVLSFWKAGFSPSGIPSMLIDEAIPFMNRKVSEYLELITNGRYIVSFDTLAETKSGEIRDKISVRVVDTYTKANSRIQLSGGQTRLIDICTILTLGDLQCNIQDVKFNILLFDEIFDALDDENVTYVSKVLQKLKMGKSICLISHTHQDQLEADEVLSFR